MPKVYFGKRGGQYIMKYGKKVYIKNKFGLPEGDDPTPEAVQFLRQANNFIKVNPQLWNENRFGKGKTRFGADSKQPVWNSPEEAYSGMYNIAMHYQSELDKCNRSLFSKRSSPVSWDGPIGILSRQNSLNSGENSPTNRGLSRTMGRYLGGADPSYSRN